MCTRALALAPCDACGNGELRRSTSSRRRPCPSGRSSLTTRRSSAGACARTPTLRAEKLYFLSQVHTVPRTGRTQTCERTQTQYALYLYLYFIIPSQLRCTCTCDFVRSLLRVCPVSQVYFVFVYLFVFAAPCAQDFTHNEPRRRWHVEQLRCGGAAAALRQCYIHHKLRQSALLCCDAAWKCTLCAASA